MLLKWINVHRYIKILLTVLVSVKVGSFILHRKKSLNILVIRIEKLQEHVLELVKLLHLLLVLNNKSYLLIIDI